MHWTSPTPIALTRGVDIVMELTSAPAKDLPRGRNVCTTIVTHGETRDQQMDGS